MNFAVGDLVEHPMFLTTYRVVAVLEPDPRGADLVLVNISAIRASYFLDKSSEYSKVTPKLFEVGKTYKHRKSATTFEVVDIKKDRAIGWKTFNGGGDVEGWVCHNNNRIYWEEIAP